MYSNNLEPPTITLPPRGKLTDKQWLVLSFILYFYQKEDRIPSSHEIRDKMGWASQTAAIGHLRALAKKGYLEHRTAENGNRAWYRFPRMKETFLPTHHDNLI